MVDYRQEGKMFDVAFESKKIIKVMDIRSK